MMKKHVLLFAAVICIIIIGISVWTVKAEEPYHIYFGQLHSHTEYSTGLGTCREAYEYARNVPQIDFLAVTDHSEYFDNRENVTLTDGSASEIWTEGQALADEYTDENFVAIFGYEMTWRNGTGHMNTFNTGGFLSTADSQFNSYADGMQNYYDELKKAEGCIGQWNHAGSWFGDFRGFSNYDEEIDERIQLIEAGNGSGPIGESGYYPYYTAYQKALDKGWHVAPTNNQDNHKADWGSANTARSVVLANNLTRADIYDAMANRRVYAAEDNDLSIYYTLDGAVMGTILEGYDTGELLNISVQIEDPTDADSAQVQVITESGEVLAEKTMTQNPAALSFTLQNNNAYYYIKVVQGDGDIAVTAPVWTGKVTEKTQEPEETKIPKETETEKETQKETQKSTETQKVKETQPKLLLPSTPKVQAAATKTYKNIKVSWNKVTDAKGYYVYRKTGKNGKYKKLATVTKTSYTDKTAACGKTYYYTVKAYNANGTSSYNKTGVKAVSNIPAAVKLKSTKAGVKKATVKWSKTIGASGYQVYMATSKKGTYKKVKTLSSKSKVSYVKKKLKKGKTYYFKVRAYKTVSGKKVYGAYSNVKSVKIKK